jgi:alpha-D-ribose 1-methylphosphonate 5-triphosphate synthase subunit PhnH
MTVTATASASVPISAALSQQVFRAVLDALARPGTVQRLPAAGHGDDHADESPAALLPLLTLAELTTPVCVLADGADGPEWGGVVRAMTSAPAVALAQARLVAALRPVTEGELASLNTGSAAAPEDGALACLSVAGIRPVPDSGNPDGRALGGVDDRLLRLSGPGIPGTRRLVITGLPPGFVAARRELTRDFPAGADLLLITVGGDITGLPRTTLIDEEAG